MEWVLYPICPTNDLCSRTKVNLSSNTWLLKCKTSGLWSVVECLPVLHKVMCSVSHHSQSINQSIHPSIHQPISQSINQFIHQPISQSIKPTPSSLLPFALAALSTQLHVVYLGHCRSKAPTLTESSAILNTLRVKSRLWPRAAQPWNGAADDCWLNLARVSSQLWLTDDPKHLFYT